MNIITRYILLLFVTLCSILAFSQEKEKPEVIYVPYSDTISQELVDYIRSRTKPYILTYHYDMRHLIPEMRCRIQRAKRIGVFSVSKDKQVSFSQGNLQYHRKRYEWRFADNQYDYIGEGNIKDGQLADRVDLFGWSTDNPNTPWGINLTQNNSVFVGQFVDWGENNVHNEPINTWRTLSNSEWKYLLKSRPNAAELYAFAQIDTINGIIILPDDWQPIDSIPLKMGNNPFADNQLSFAQWNILEVNNAVFLPAAGVLMGKNYNHTTSGLYWSSTADSENDTYAYSLYFPKRYIYFDYTHQRSTNRSVRLVHDTIVPPPAPCRTIEVNGVKFNMMCVEGGTFMMGATEEQLPYAQANEKPAHQVTVSDFMIGETEVTQELWTAVMGTTIEEHHAANPSSSIIAGVGDTHPMYMINKADCQKFISKLNELTGLYFRLPTEAEWEYAARGGNRSRGFVYAGSDTLDLVAWHLGNSGNKAHPVAQKQPNELGIYDMSGNVWEWVSDWASDYIADAQVNPTGPAMGEYYIIRGGSRGWSNQKMSRVSARKTDKKTGDGDRAFIGLRLVMDIHQYVDLGLSVMWATTNVGATASEEYGDYFAWGEVEPKDVYDWATYKWCDGTEQNIIKYNAEDGLTTLLLEDDAAHANWGGEWRMPTKDEFQELIDYCTFEITQLNGVKGTWITSKINGNRIFVPYAGYYNHGNGGSADKNHLSQQRLWTSTKATRSNHAWNFYNQSNEGNTRRCGFPVRPVLTTERELLPPVVPGKRIGVFSVAKDKQVSFSQGNLQYVQSLNHWRFADNQLYYIGERHLRNGQIADTVMYFGWSAKDSPTPWGIGLETNVEKYKGEFLDWGVNEIQGDKANTWRTMSNDEWIYLFTERKNAAQLMGRGKVDDINGVILLPDDWVLPDGLSFAPIDDAVINHYTAEQWAKMESVGAVFIPAAGYFNNRLNPKMRFVGEYAYAASCNTLKDGVLQLYNAFTETTVSYSVTGTSSTTLYYAFLRRLVHDTIVPFEPEYVDLGLSVMWATTNVGATAPEEYGDYFAWGEVESKDVYSWETYKWCDGTKSGITKYNAEDGLTTLLPEDDVAYVNWGGEWRMPTKNELTELRERCTWEWTIVNGVNGCRVTGPNGNSIFLPAAGSYNSFDDQLNSVGSVGWLFSSDRASNPSVHELGFSSTGAYQTNCSRCVGLTIRPVIPTDRKYIPEYVDMGLSVKWASCNLGTSIPNGVGDFYAWGETTPKDSYTVKNYKWCNGSANAITKYCTVDTLGNNGFTDGLTTLQLGDDAAYMQKGGKWRMPTDEEWDELRTQCTWTLTEKLGMSGYEVTSKINGNTIFIPVAGFRSGENIVLDYIGAYWSSSLNESKQTCALGLYINKNENRVGRYSNSNRCNGFLIRPVYDENKVTVTVNATPSTSKIGFLCIGYTRVGNTITVDKGKSVLYLVTNLEERYLSQGDSLLNLTKDTTLNVTLVPFSEGHWVTLDTSKFEHVVDYYISRNSGAVAGKYTGWSYYILPVEEGETYRVTTKGGQLAAPWLVVSSLPDPETKTRATKVVCSDIKGPVSVVSEEFIIPSGGGKWLIINASHDGKELVLEKYLPYRYGFGQQLWDECNGRWGHGGRGHAPADQSVIQGTYVNGVRLNVAVKGSLNVYKVPSLTETTDDNFVLVATLTTDKLGVQDIDFSEPIYVGENEYLVFGKPSEPMPTLGLLYNTNKYGYVVQSFTHFIGTDKAKKAGSALMVDFY